MFRTISSRGLGSQREIACPTAHCVDTAQPPESRPTKTETYCHLYHSVRIEIVSDKSLPKTGVSAVLAGDFWEILAEVV